MIFITSYRKLHLSGNFWTFKTQSTEYDNNDDTFVENYIFKKLEEPVEILKKTNKKPESFSGSYKVYILCTPKCDAFGSSFFLLLSIMECYEPNR